MSGLRSLRWDYRPGLECDFCGKKTWTERRQNGQRQCRGCKVIAFYNHVLLNPLGFNLPEWCSNDLYNIYGTLDESTGLRQYRSAFLSVAKQNGKTFMVGGLPIYHILMEDEFNPEVVGAAAAKDQADLVYKATKVMIDGNPKLMTKLRVVDSRKQILEREGPGIYKVVSADGDVQDGQRPSLLIRDEIHRWKSLRHETVKDVLTKGQISRDEPLDIQITTVGAEYECPMWWAEHQFALDVMKDPSIAPQYYAHIYGADPKRMESDPEYWKSREARVAANPSHEDNGGHLKDAALVLELNKAIRDPAERPKFLRYHLNIPLRQTEEPIIDMMVWYQNGDPIQKELDQKEETDLAVDLRQWPTFDEDLLLRKWGLIPTSPGDSEEPCFCGLDTSWTTDLTACVFCFPPTERNEIWTILPFFWIPKGQIIKLTRQTRRPIQTWVDQGFITASNGNAIDMGLVRERIRWGSEMFNLLEIDYDPWNKSEIFTLGEEKGMELVEIKQNFGSLSNATKNLLSIYLDKGFRHGNHPVLNWMASCLQLQYDHKDNIQPSKPERGASSKRIDGMSGIVNALSRALVAPKPKKSVYATRGLRTIKVR